jgi:hypothetical protein
MKIWETKREKCERKRRKDKKKWTIKTKRENEAKNGA